MEKMNFQKIHKEKDNLIMNRIQFLMERMIIFDSIEDVLHHIIKNAVSIVRADAATLRVFDISTGRLEPRACFGLSIPVKELPPLSLGEGIAGRVVLTGEPFMSTDIGKVSFCSSTELVELEGLRSVLSVPLKTREYPVGCITTFRKSEEAFTDTDLLLLNIFATKAVDAIENTKLVNDLKRQVTFDHLTNIYNRSFLLKRIEEEIQRASRYNLEFSLVFIDIDDFKRFNDANGHLLGDKLLADFSSLLRSQMRKNDIIGRYGGEEFIIVCPQSNKQGTLIMTNRLIGMVNQFNFMGKNDYITGVGFSAGISAYPEDGKTVEEIIGKADEAMYIAKKQGKNKVIVCGEYKPG